MAGKGRGRGKKGRGKYIPKRSRSRSSPSQSPGRYQARILEDADGRVPFKKTTIGGQWPNYSGLNREAPFDFDAFTKEQRRDEDFFRRYLRLGAGCRVGECVANRQYDPFCLCQLDGPQKTPVELPDFGYQSAPEPMRTQGTPAGLRNLGNTCYMNSYLQSLFHVLPVRRTLFDWRMPPAERRVAGERYDVAAALRNLFIRLQTSRDRAVDPMEFVRAAGVNATRQQDPQEFSLLFLNWLDHVLAEKPGEEKLQDLFKGRTLSATRCSHCGVESSSETDFLDLSIHAQGISDLMTALVIALGEEVVESRHCDFCGRTCKANIRKQLTRLPRILTIQLNRIAFDRATMSQKKLGHPVEFPMALDIRAFLTPEQTQKLEPDGYCYELKAVLIHLGDAAGGGHYFARIRVANDGKWYTFNDSFVSPYAQKERDTDYRGVYMLVYEKRRDPDRNARDPPVPVEMPDQVPAHAGHLVERLYALKRTLGGGRVDLLLANLKAKAGNEIMWIPVDWLQRLIRELRASSTEKMIPPPAMQRYQCPHGQLARINGLKAVDYAQMETLLSILDIAPVPVPFDGHLFCLQCNWEMISRGAGGVQSEKDDDGDQSWDEDDFL